MMGVHHSYAFRNNCAIIHQSNISESKLMKHWNTLTFHCVREAVTSGFLQLNHIPGNVIPANLHMKFPGYQEAIPYLLTEV